VYRPGVAQPGSRSVLRPRNGAPSARTLAALLIGALGLGCAHPIERRDWSAFDGPGAQHFHAEEIEPPSFPDPLEPVNRSVAAVNHGAILWVVRPLGSAYRLVVPRFVRDRFRDFGANLLWPRNLVANLLQARWRAAGTETARFGINTTVGIAGFWDPARRWWSIEPRPEDMGQVFGTWGWKPSTFVMLPLAGPSTLRDGVGMLPDALLDPTTWYFPASLVSYFLSFNEIVDQVPGYQTFVASTFDAYDDARLLWTLNRDEEIRDAPPPPHPDGADTGAVQSLQAAFIAPRDPEFGRSLRTRRVRIPHTGRELPYSVRLQPEKAPTVFLVPGLGTHRLGSASVALAEMAWRRGFSVVIVSSAFSFEFMQRAASAAMPGHAPVDSRDVHLALDRIAADLDAREPGRVGARVFMGYSMGAFHGFFIAADQETGSQPLVQFERFVLLDPPVRLVHGLEKLDRFYNAPLVYPPEEREEAVMNILRRTLDFARRALAEGDGAPSYDRFDATDLGDGNLQPGLELPFTNLEAEFLIGLAFRRTLQSILWVSQERYDQGVLRTRRTSLRRWSAYQEIGDYSYSEYLYGFVLPYYRDRVGLIETSDELVEANDLHAIAEPLSANERLRVFANANDFLTSNEDVEWLREWIGPERVVLLPTGGHLGNLNRPELQDSVMDSLEDLRHR
jgi:phospholipid-binding lipoprotein MlaA